MYVRLSASAKDGHYNEGIIELRTHACMVCLLFHTYLFCSLSIYIIKGLFLMHPFRVLISVFVAIKVNKVTVPFQPKSIPSRSRFSHAYSNINVFYKKSM